MTEPSDVLAYWFGPLDAPDYPRDNSQMWWKKNPEVDREVAARFSDALEASARGELSHWKDNKESRLAHIILTDQMSRNMHRDTAQMFAHDDLALELSLLCLSSGERYSNYHQRMFQYMPLMHAENVAIQRLCTHLFAREMAEADNDDVRQAATRNHDFAEQHQVIVERFGRFPHRNNILGRKSTAEEIEFLKEPGSSF
ncbi:MAG: DUF924 domain-containing protein [Granulosicoccus sp.]|nr:DUF924 domain-containing protein [Granulosicoccus sp.]